MFATIMTKSLLVVACCITCNVRGNVQESFPSGGSAFDPYDTGLFWPLEDLGLLSSTEFTTLGHPKFPKYGVRIKKSDFCDGTVRRVCLLGARKELTDGPWLSWRAFTGYIDIEARHLFFYFFESRNEPDTDDVIFWTNGGPGCSSSTGLFMELGKSEHTLTETKFLGVVTRTIQARAGWPLAITQHSIPTPGTKRRTSFLLTNPSEPVSHTLITENTSLVFPPVSIQSVHSNDSVIEHYRRGGQGHRRIRCHLFWALQRIQG